MYVGAMTLEMQETQNVVANNAKARPGSERSENFTGRVLALPFPAT